MNMHSIMMVNARTLTLLILLGYQFQTVMSFSTPQFSFHVPNRLSNYVRAKSFSDESSTTSSPLEIAGPMIAKPMKLKRKPKAAAAADVIEKTASEVSLDADGKDVFTTGAPPDVEAVDMQAVLEITLSGASTGAAEEKASYLFNRQLKGDGYTHKGYRKGAKLPARIVKEVVGAETMFNATRELLLDTMASQCLSSSPGDIGGVPTGYFDVVRANRSDFTAGEPFPIELNVHLQPKISYTGSDSGTSSSSRSSSSSSDSSSTGSMDGSYTGGYTEAWRREAVPRWSGVGVGAGAGTARVGVKRASAGSSAAGIPNFVHLQQTQSDLSSKIIGLAVTPSNYTAQIGDTVIISTRAVELTDNGFKKRPINGLENNITMAIALNTSREAPDLVNGLLGVKIGDEKEIEVRLPVNGRTLVHLARRGSSQVHQVTVMDIQPKEIQAWSLGSLRRRTSSVGDGSSESNSNHKNISDEGETESEAAETIRDIVQLMEEQVSALLTLAVSKNSSEVLAAQCIPYKDVIEALRDNTAVPSYHRVENIPKAIIDHYISNFYQSFQHIMQSVCGLSQDQIDQLSDDPNRLESFRAIVLPVVLQQLKLDMVCSDIARAENITVQETEIERILHRVKKSFYARQKKMVEAEDEAKDNMSPHVNGEFRGWQHKKAQEKKRRYTSARARRKSWKRKQTTPLKIEGLEDDDEVDFDNDKDVLQRIEDSVNGAIEPLGVYDKLMLRTFLLRQKVLTFLATGQR